MQKNRGDRLKNKSEASVVTRCGTGSLHGLKYFFNVYIKSTEQPKNIMKISLYRNLRTLNVMFLVCYQFL